MAKSPEIRRAEEELAKSERLRSRNIAKANCQLLLLALNRDQQNTKSRLNDLRESLKELSQHISPARDVKGISGYLIMKEGRPLLRVLRQLPPEIYSELDELVGLPPQLTRKERLVEAKNQTIQALRERAALFARAFTLLPFIESDNNTDSTDSTE